MPSFLPITPSTLTYVPQTNNSVLVVTSVQGSAYSEDGGVTWKRINTQAYFSLSFASPTAGWAAGPRPGRIVKFAGNFATVGVVNRQESEPEEFELLQNFPNPFNPRTTIVYSIFQPALVELKIYDTLGREIQTLVNAFQAVGKYHVDFEASQFTNGVYFYNLRVGNYFSETKKMLYLK